MRVSPSATSLAWLLLCSSCAPENPPDGASLPQAIDLWGRYVNVSCARARACCEQAQFDSSALATCEEELSIQQGIPEVLRFIAEGSATLDGQTFDRCLDAAEQTADQCGEGNPFEDCGDVLAGTLAQGEACESAIQCSAPHGAAVCRRIVPDDVEDDGSIKGQCFTEVRGASGSPCFETCASFRCSSTFTSSDDGTANTFCFVADGLYCDRQRGECAPLVEIGDACSLDEACGLTGFCGAEQRCEPRRGEGEPCEDWGECAEPLSCLNGRCVERPTADADYCAGDYD